MCAVRNLEPNLKNLKLLQTDIRNSDVSFEMDVLQCYPNTTAYLGPVYLIHFPNFLEYIEQLKTSVRSV